MSESISTRIQNDLTQAMKARDADTLSTLRMIKAGLMEAKTKKPKDATLSPEEELEVLQRYVKKRREAIEEFRKHDRLDLVAKEEAEIAVTQRYLPQGLSEAEVEAIVEAAIAKTAAAGPKDLGKVMGVVVPQVKGRADGAAVTKLVKEKLGG